MKQEKKIYVCPSCEVLEVETQHAILAMSGQGFDSDDSEFGAPAKASRSGEWGNLWNE